MLDELDQLRIDWTDFEAAGHSTRAVLQRLVSDKRSLRELVYRVEKNERLLAMCEQHQLLNYLVLYDHLDRGVRIRLHVTPSDTRDRPHDHRFSFSSVILRGRYRHTFHELTRPIYDASRDDSCRSWQNLQNPDPDSHIDFTAVKPVFTRHERPGSCYSLHHSSVHALSTSPETVSLVIRGPAEKRRSIIMDAETQTYWWRYGQHEETPERRKSKCMPLETYRALRGRLEALEVI